MFRRKPRSKNSYVPLYSSSRGSDIKKPENTSLIVHDSDTETDPLPKELTSIFSEDEDENLEGPIRSSSFLKSLSQKTQSTPLSRSSQNDIFKKKENIRCQSQKPRNCSNLQKISYFEDVLKACGAIPLGGDSSFQLSQDQAVFSIKVSKKLKESTENVKKFIESVQEKLNDVVYLQKMLAHTLTAENCEVARGPIQEPMMRMLLNVDCLQSELVELLLNIIADLVMDNMRTESENVQLVSSILRQLSFLSGLKDIKIASKLFEIIHIASFNIKREIIFLLPEIISEDETEETCGQLIEMLKFDEMLSRVIIDTMGNLSLSNTLRSKVCYKILHRLDKCPLEFLPSFVQFVLNKTETDEFNEVINGLRDNLPFTPQHNQIKKAENTIDCDEDSFIKLTFENIKFSVMASKELTDAWIRVINNINSSNNFRCVDLVMVIIFYSCLFGRKGQILQLIRNKIKSEVLTQNHVRNMFEILVVITQEYSSSILEMASAFLKSFDGKISSLGAVLYKECFVHYHTYMKQIVVSEILLHVGTGSPCTITTALTTLRELCETEKKSLSQYTASIMGLLVKVQDLELAQVRLLIDVIADLVFFELLDNGSGAEDELQIFIRKMLISSKVEHSKKGVSAAIMFGKHSLKECYGEEGDYTQINSLLELAMGSNGTSDTNRGFFNDEFATLARESKSRKSFLKIWSEKTLNLITGNLLVKDLDVESSDFPMSLQYSLDVEDVEKFVFPAVEFVIKSHDGTKSYVSVPVIPSTLRLLWCLEGNLVKILPVFCASVIMPDITVYDNFYNYDELQKRKIMDCLFLCGNYLIECINALSTHGLFDKAAMRLKHLVSVRKLIARFINQIPGFVPPYCQFYAPIQKVVVKKKPEKKATKGRKRKYQKEAPEETSNSVVETQQTPETNIVCSGENIQHGKQPTEEADLHPYFGFFRELDFATFNILSDVKSRRSSKASKTNVELETSEFLFLVEDLIYKSEEILKSAEVPFTLKTKSVALMIKKMPAEEFIMTSLKILPQLLSKMETFSEYCENLLEANDWILDSHGLYVEGASHVKLAMASGLKFISEIISWRGFQNQNSKLLKDFLTIITKKTVRGNSSLECSSGLAADAATYLAKFSKSVMLLSGGLSIVKSFLVCLRFSLIETSSDLADLCREFLCRNWFTVTGAPEKGSVYNQQIEFILKTYFSYVDDKLEVVRRTAKTALDEVGGLSAKDSSLKTFKTINKSNFPLLYRTICEALVLASTKELPKTGTDNDKQLNVWNKIIDTLMMLVETAKIHPSRIILASLLKRSQSVIQLFLSKGMPIAGTALRIKSMEVLKLLKSFQIVTRFLHSICCQSRITNDSVVAAHVPSIRSLCERLTLEVKGMLILNGIPMDCITIGILKNRDIKGNDIISQETLDQNSDDDSEIPPEDTPDVEESTNDNLDGSGSNDEESREKAEQEEGPVERAKLCCSARLLFSINCFFAIFNVTYLRVGISMALVCMVIPEGKSNEKTTQGEFHWSSTTKGHVFSSVFYGLFIGPFVAGILSFKFGGKIILVIGTICSGALNLFAPEAARLTPILLIVIRIATGFFAGFILPAMYDLVSKWIVPEERQLLVTWALVGVPTASILNFPITGFICDFLGWVWIFYSIAIWIVFWGILYAFLTYDQPEKCPFISKKELRYLKSRIPKSEKMKIPWKKIVKSLPIYAYFVIHFSVSYVHLTLIFSLPLLMESVHEFPLRENGFVSASPFVGSFLMRIALSLSFEQVRSRLKLSKNTLRKICVFLGAVLVSLFFLIITFLSRSYRYWVIGCFVLASSSLELCISGGYILSFLDLCPSYVNILSGLANIVANAAGLISPVVNGKLTPHGTREEWNAVFYINASIILGAMIFYVAFGKNNLLYWGLSGMRPGIPRASIIH